MFRIPDAFSCSWSVVFAALVINVGHGQDLNKFSDSSVALVDMSSQVLYQWGNSGSDQMWFRQKHVYNGWL